MAKTKQITDAPTKKVAKKAPKKASVKQKVETPIMVNLDLNCIKLDPNNPRKHFDETKMDELIESVRENGVLQPIVVRPLGDDYHYIIIAGERRYRAAAAVATGYKDRMSIPAVIRTSVTEEEARELQIVENIQRADMHPMEEAEAFAQLYIDHKVEEISAKVGKSVYYVRQRLKLNNLIADWTTAFKADHISNALALKLAVLGPDAQMSLYDDSYDGQNTNINDFYFKKFQTQLSDAPFDQSVDYEGLPKCGNCPYNSAYNSLFPDQDPTAYCKNVKCFDLKKAYAFDLEIQKAKEDPGVILIGDTYNLSEEEKRSWIKNDLEVYNENDLDLIEAPDEDDYDFDPEQDADDLLQEKKRYEQDLKEYQENLKKPNVVKALQMNGYSKGEIFYGTLIKNPDLITREEPKSSNGKSSKESDPNQEIKDEIDRIKTKEERAKELDGEKVWAKIAELLTIDKNRNVLFNLEPLSQAELYAAAKAIENKVSWNNQSWIKEYIGKIEPTITDLGLNGLLRLFLCDVLISNYGSHLRKDSNNQVAYNVLKSYFPDKIAAYELEQKEISDKRQARVNERIAALKKKLSK